MRPLLILRDAGNGLHRHIGQGPPRSAWQRYRARSGVADPPGIESSGSAVGWSGLSARKSLTPFAKDVACWSRKVWRH